MVLSIAIDYPDPMWEGREDKKVTQEYAATTISDLLRQCGITEGLFKAELYYPYVGMRVTKSLVVGEVSGKGNQVYLSFNYLPHDVSEIPVLSCRLSGSGNPKEIRALKYTIRDFSRRLNEKAKQEWNKGEPDRKRWLLEQSLQNTIDRKQQRKTVLKKKLKSIRKEIKEIEKQLCALQDSKGANS